MKRIFILALAFLSISNMQAQYKKEFGGCLGFSNYLGDIGGGKASRHDFVRDLKVQQTRYTINGYFRYKLTKDFSTRSSFIYTRLIGDDKNSTNPGRVTRNLSFKTDLIELMQTVEWNFFQQTKMSSRASILGKGGKKRIDFRAFFFTGIGAIFFNPRAELDGKMYNLRGIQTEGVKYSPVSWAAPFGVGFAYTLNKKIRVGADISYRFTGTDFLDDVSGNYAVSYNDALNSSKNSSKSKDDIRNMLGNRTYEVQAYLPTEQGTPVTNFNSNLPVGANYDVVNGLGTKRGGNFNPNTGKSAIKGANERDGYFLLNITAGYVLKGKNKYYKSKYRNIVNRRKVVKKKTRAKF